MRAINPYIVGNPIKDQSVFFGRQDVFRDVMQVLRQPGSNAIVLYGQRRIGKTSVLLQLEKHLRQDGEFTPVYFDLQDKAAKSLSEVLYELSQHISRVTTHPVANPVDFDPAGDYFRRVFLPEVADKVASGGLVLLFDEFDVLDSPMRTQASEAFFPYLRHWMDDLQKIKFVFVIGRRPEDLSVRTMATFKGIQSTRVSFLTKKDARDVVIQSERDGSLVWDKDATERVLQLTNGHPYFTQLLCSVIWENAHEDTMGAARRVSTQDVEEAVTQSLKFGANAFNWIWDGLPPAERVVIAAMAEVSEELITQDKLIETLNSSGVRLVARELEVAPETLIDWEVLIASKDAYRFAVPLLRRWVILNRPLRRVKEELDRLNPLAENLYQSGQGFYGNSQLDPAEQQLRQALNINPNHLKARLLLGQVLLEKGNFSESVAIFDAAYQYDERAARAELIKALLALADTQEENLQLSTYGRILSIQSDQPLANEKIRAIWIQRGQSAMAQENFEEALKAFEQIGDTKSIEMVRARMHEKRLSLEMQRAEHYEDTGEWKLALDTLVELAGEYPESETLKARMETARMNWRQECLQALIMPEQEENWAQVLEICESLEADFPDDADVRARANRAREQQNVALKYREALEILESGQREKAREMFSSILSQNPAHLHAAHKLIETTYGKVKILAPIPLAVQIAALISTALWTIVLLFLTSGLFANIVVANVDMNGPFRYHLNTETFILIGVILIPLVGMLLGFYTTSVIDRTYKVDREQPSYATAIWAHLILGMGMFYVNPNARRKWLYLLLALLVAVLALSMVFYQTTEAMNIGIFTMKKMWDGQMSNILEFMLWLFLGLFLVSFVDVMVACSVQRTSNFARKGEARALNGQVAQAEHRRPRKADRGPVGWILRADETDDRSLEPELPPVETSLPGDPSTSVYVLPSDGIPLYRTLPASDNWTAWLERGAQLSLLDPIEDVSLSIGKFGHYLWVMDTRGNRGYVNATAVGLTPPPAREGRKRSATLAEEPETS